MTDLTNMNDMGIMENMTNITNMRILMNKTNMTNKQIEKIVSLIFCFLKKF